MTDERPIGIFDSGVGGLSILFELERALPSERFIYYADTLRCPWGSRAPNEIVGLAGEATAALVALGCKLIVVACNSATTLAIAALRERFAVPFVGTVPAVRPAARLSKRGAIGVLATAATVSSPSLGALIDEFAPDADVYCHPCPDELVELIEAGTVDGPRVATLLREPLEEVRRRNADVLVLGCTHYAFLRPAIRRLVGDSLTVLDTGVPVARQVARVLDSHDLNAFPDRARTPNQYVATADSRRFDGVAASLRQSYSEMANATGRGH